MKRQTDAIVNAFRMALDEVNNTVGGASILYEDLDDATPERGDWDAGKEVNNATQAVGDPDVMVYLGTFNSGAAKHAMPITNRAQLVMISPSNAYPGLTKPGLGEPNEPEVYRPSGRPNYTRVAPADDVQGMVGATWARQLGARAVYVLEDGEPYGHILAVSFADAARSAGLNVAVGPEVIDTKASEYRALAAKIRGASADLVYFGGITQNNAGRLVRDLRAVLGNGVRFMGPDGLYEQTFVDAAGDAAEGAYITYGGILPQLLSGNGATWYRQYRTRFNAEPEVYAAYGYDAMKVALDAIQRAGRKDRAAIRDAVFATRDFDGVLGRWSFDQNGDTTLRKISGRQIRGGKFDDANAVLIEGPR